MKTILATAVLGATVLTAALIAQPTVAADYTKGSIKVATPWTRATPGGARVAGGFMTITNTGTTADRLIGGSFPVAGVFEVHEMKMENDIMRMRRLPKGLEIKPGATVALKPGSYHVMFMELKAPIKEGMPIKGTLIFEKAGTIEVEYQVAKIGARSLESAAGAGKGGMQGHGMKH